MRRSTKPFTVEVKKRGGRRREAGDPVAERLSMPSETFGETGRDSRFRDAESFFRPIPQTDPGFAEAESASPVAIDAATPADSTPRRILPDLIAEAALSEATQVAMPEPRRRGRPPKDRSNDLPQPVRARKPIEPDSSEDVFEFPDIDEAAPSPPAVLYLAASARRRAGRATDNLPRAERWKRRLPKACW